MQTRNHKDQENTGMSSSRHQHTTTLVGLGTSLFTRPLLKLITPSGCQKQDNQLMFLKYRKMMKNKHTYLHIYNLHFIQISTVATFSFITNERKIWVHSKDFWFNIKYWHLQFNKVHNTTYIYLIHITICLGSKLISLGIVEGHVQEKVFLVKILLNETLKYKLSILEVNAMVLNKSYYTSER